MKFSKNNFFKNYGFSLLMILSVILGSTVGIFLKEDATILKPLGDIFLNLMFTIVVPLVFFTITSSIAKMLDLKRLGKIMGYSLFVFVATCIIAATVMLVSVKIISPVGDEQILIDSSEVVEKVSIGDRIVQALTVNDFSDVLSRSHMLPLIVFSILLGIGISLLKEKGQKLTELLDIGSQALMRVVKIIMIYAPIGLFGYFANLIGTFGTSLIEGYLRSFIIYVVVGIIYYLVFYTIYAYISAGKLGV